MPKWIMILLVAVMAAILKCVSQEIRNALPGWLNELEQRANQTPNPVDNSLVDFLRELLSVQKDALYKS